MGPIEVKRFLFHELAVTPSTTLDQFDAAPVHRQFLVATETQNEQLEADGTNIPTVPQYSKIVGAKGPISIARVANDEVCRWIIYKMEDGESLISNMSTHFHSSDDTQAIREIRSKILAKGMIVGSDKTSGRIPLYFKRSTLKRLGSLRDGDSIALLVESNLTSTNAVVIGFGGFYVRLN